MLSISFWLDQPPSGLSNSYKSDPPHSNLSNLFKSDLPPNHKKTDEESISKFLWWDVYRHISIKDFLSKQTSICEHTWDVVTYKMMIGEGHSGPDIWPKTPNQSTGTKEIIFTTWYKKTIK